MFEARSEFLKEQEEKEREGYAKQTILGLQEDILDDQKGSRVGHNNTKIIISLNAYFTASHSEPKHHPEPNICQFKIFFSHKLKATFILIIRISLSSFNPGGDLNGDWW